MQPDVVWNPWTIRLIGLKRYHVMSRWLVMCCVFMQHFNSLSRMNGGPLTPLVRGTSCQMNMMVTQHTAVGVEASSGCIGTSLR